MKWDGAAFKVYEVLGRQARLFLWIFMFDHGRLSDTYMEELCIINIINGRRWNHVLKMQSIAQYCRTQKTHKKHIWSYIHANEFQSLVETFCRFKSQAKVFVTSSIAACRYLQVEICRWNGESGLSGFFNQPAPFTHEIWKRNPWHAWIYFGNTCVQKSDKSMKVIGNNLWMSTFFIDESDESLKEF